MIAFIIIGIVLLVVAYVLGKQNETLAKVVPFIRMGAFLLMIIGALSSIFVQIEPGKTGVKVLFGSVQNDVLESGLHVVNPMIEVQEFDVQTQNYTMSSIHDEGDRDGDDAIRVLSSDGLEVVIDLTVLYRISPKDAPRILKEIGQDYTSKIVRPIARTRIRDNSVYYEAVALYSTKKSEFQQRIFKSIEADFKQRGLILEQLLIRNINLPESVKKTIESKINAEQESQKMTFVLAKERQEAERKRVEAQGIADYQRIVSNGLTDKQLQYEKIKAQMELAKSSNTKVLIMDGKSTPIILGDK